MSGRPMPMPTPSPIFPFVSRPLVLGGLVAVGVGVKSAIGEAEVSKVEGKVVVGGLNDVLAGSEVGEGEPVRMGWVDQSDRVPRKVPTGLIWRYSSSAGNGDLDCQMVPQIDSRELLLV